MKKIICALLLAAVLLAALPAGAFAAENTKCADTLFALGLFRGTDEGYALDSPLTRAQAAVMLVRLIGAEADAEAENTASIFSDVPDEHWAKSAVMYCYENDITKGTSADTFTPDREISAREFVTLVLRILGYSAEPEDALAEAVNARLLTSGMSRAFTEEEHFLRDDMVLVALRALKTEDADGTVFSQRLIDAGVISETHAEEYDLMGAAGADTIDEMLDELLG